MSQPDLLPEAPLPVDWMERYDPADLAARWPKTLAESVDVVAAGLERHGLSEAEAIELAQIAMLEIATLHGGRPFYLPRGDRLKEALRDRAMWKNFPHKTVEQLADESGLTVRRVQQILAEQRKLVTRRIQPSLFGDDTAQ